MPDNERYAYVNNQRVDLYHPDINKRQEIRRDYIQYLNEGVPTMKQLMVRGMGASQAAEEISKSQKFRNELAQKFRQEKEEADGITKQPTFYEVLSGAESKVDMPVGFEEFKEKYEAPDTIDFSKETIEEDPEEYAMRTIYEERVKRKDRELKKRQDM